ncbi:MAG: YdeI/OmpD-associated family protein [Thiobacillaceae bacterium]
MKKYKIKATIQAGIGGGAAVAFPYDVEKEFGVKGNVPVNATFNGIPYSGSLMKCGGPAHMLGILKSIRTQIGKDSGDSVEVVVWKDEEPRVVETPADLASLLKERGLLAAFEKLSYTHRKEFCRWITEAKREETRRIRVAKAADMLSRNVKTPA